MADIYCSYCNSLIIGERCDSCGAPIINTCKHITITNLKTSISNQKESDSCSSAYTLNIKRGGIVL